MKATTRTTIRFRDCDPAGILFFGRPYELAHDAFEELVKSMGFTSEEWFNNAEFGTPVRHSSCEYFKPMRAGEEIEIETKVESLGDSSFTLQFLFTHNGEKRCEVKLVHVCINLKAFSKMSLPLKVRERLEAHKL